MGACMRTRIICVEVGCLVFGYLQIFAALALITWTVWIVVGSVGSYPIPSGSWLYSGSWQHLVVRAAFAAIVLIMAVVLVTGVNSRKEGYVLAYFIVGVAATVGVTTECIILATSGLDSRIVCAILASMLVYASCLSLVYAVYRDVRLQRRSHIGGPYLTLLEDHHDGADQENA